jgi:putative SOS response-associated peptidase YedK
LRRAGHVVLRICADDAAQDADVVCAKRGQAPLRFAGLWTRWHGTRGTKSAPVEGEHELFGFLTTEANAIVAPIHPKAMPVVLTTPEEVDLWLEGETIAALKLQRPLPDGALRIVARGEKEDRAAAFAR